MNYILDVSIVFMFTYVVNSSYDSMFDVYTALSRVFMIFNSIEI